MREQSSGVEGMPNQESTGRRRSRLLVLLEPKFGLRKRVRSCGTRLLRPSKSRTEVVNESGQDQPTYASEETHVRLRDWERRLRHACIEWRN
jgi:hypothetical protein